MFTSVIKGGLIAAVAGVAMQALATAPAEAFTLGAASPAATVASADVDHVWWDRFGRWHPNHHYWGGPGPFYWHHPHYWRHCHWGRCW